MVGKKLTLIGASPSIADWPLVKAVLQAWPDGERPAVEFISYDDVLANEKSLARCGLAWLLLDAPPRGLYSLLDSFLERHLPALLTQQGDDRPTGTPVQDGVIVAAPDTPPAMVAAMLRSLWSHAAIVHVLADEIGMLRTHQGGLSDQIDKIDEELRLASQLQREFLPQSLPNCAALEFEVFFRPAGYVSGDIYDVIRLDEDHVGVFIADAVGHGVPAALLTMYIKRSLHTKDVDPSHPAGYRIIPPDEALARLNADMLQQQSSGKIRFATACYGVINTRTLELTLARAGHPFAMILHSDGTVTQLSPDGAMLGIFPEEVFVPEKVQLQPGDRMLMYSDGFEMAFPRKGADGKYDAAASTLQYCEEFKALAVGTLEDALRKLIAKIDLQAGSLNQRDDLTVVCMGVRRVEEAEQSIITTSEPLQLVGVPD